MGLELCPHVLECLLSDLDFVLLLLRNLRYVLVFYGLAVVQHFVTLELREFFPESELFFLLEVLSDYVVEMCRSVELSLYNTGQLYSRKEYLANVNATNGYRFSIVLVVRRVVV